MNNKSGSHLKQNSHLSKNGSKAKFHSKDGAIKVIACVLILTSLPFNSSIIMREDNNIEIVETIGFRDNYSFKDGDLYFQISKGNDLVNYFVSEFGVSGLNNRDESSIDEEIFKLIFDDLNSLSDVSDQLSYLSYLKDNPEFLWNKVTKHLDEIDSKWLEEHPEYCILNAKGCSRQDSIVNLSDITLIRSNNEMMEAIEECARDYGIPVEILVSMAAENVINGQINTANPMGINMYHWRNLWGEEYIYNYTTGESDKLIEFYSQYSDNEVMSIRDSVRYASLIYAACFYANDRDVYNTLAAYKVGTSKIRDYNNGNISSEDEIKVKAAYEYANNVINYVIANGGYNMELQLDFKTTQVRNGHDEGVALIRSEYAIREYYDEILQFIEEFTSQFKQEQKSR